MNLVVSLATRGRPGRLMDTLSRTIPNIALDSTRIVVAVDDDDEETMTHKNLVMDISDKIIWDVGAREDSIGAKWNRCLDYPADVYLVQSDYTPVMTPGFDGKILKAATVFPDGIGCVYGHMANHSFTSCQATTRKLIDKLGWMYPPYFPYWFSDHWLDDIARLIDRIAWVDVHLATPRDKPGTQEMRELLFWSTFFDSMKLVRRQQAREIIYSEDFQEPQWRKELLLGHYPLIEQRSQGINDMVREMSRGWPLSSGDGGERYDRLKAQALKMMAEQYPKLKDAA